MKLYYGRMLREACKNASRGLQYLGLCSDKASVGGFNLQASLMTLPNNQAIVAPPQVRQTRDSESKALTARANTTAI